jgi:hypothetical protein
VCTADLSEHQSGDRRYDTRHQQWCTVLYWWPSRIEKGRPPIYVWLDGSPRLRVWTWAADLSKERPR